MSNIYTDFSFWIERIENRESNEKIIWGHHIGREFNHESINFEGDLYQNEEKIRLDLSDIHIHIHNRMYDRGNPIFCVDKENKLKEQSLLAVNSSVANIFNGAVSFEFKVENKTILPTYFYGHMGYPKGTSAFCFSPENADWTGILYCRRVSFFKKKYKWTLNAFSSKKGTTVKVGDCCSLGEITAIN